MKPRPESVPPNARQKVGVPQVTEPTLAGSPGSANPPQFGSLTAEGSHALIGGKVEPCRRILHLQNQRRLREEAAASRIGDETTRRYAEGLCRTRDRDKLGASEAAVSCDRDALPVASTVDCLEHSRLVCGSSCQVADTGCGARQRRCDGRCGRKFPEPPGQSRIVGCD